MRRNRDVRSRRSRSRGGGRRARGGRGPLERDGGLFLEQGLENGLGRKADLGLLGIVRVHGCSGLKSTGQDNRGNWVNGER